MAGFAFDGFAAGSRHQVQGVPGQARIVDDFTAEFSRDIAPMRGSYTDNYYYQMVGHIRRFKGVAAPPRRPESREIQIDGTFEEGALDFIYFSVVNYTTLGFGDLIPRGPIRI